MFAPSKQKVIDEFAADSESLIRRNRAPELSPDRPFRVCLRSATRFTNVRDDRVPQVSPRKPSIDYLMLRTLSAGIKRTNVSHEKLDARTLDDTGHRPAAPVE